MRTLSRRPTTALVAWPRVIRSSQLRTILDLHTHTSVGSFDATTTPGDLASCRARLPRLHGLALTEHSRRWTELELTQLPAELLVFNERELDTGLGHIIVLGGPARIVGQDVGAIRDQVLAAGGLMILAHPFRFYPSALNLLFPMNETGWHEPGAWPPERLAEHPAFALVDAVEAFNHRVMPHQNELAAACARVRGLPIVAGSDSHAAQDLGCYATEFPDDTRTTEALIAAIRTGRCRPVFRRADGEYVPFEASPEPGAPSQAAATAPLWPIGPAPATHPDRAR